MSLPKLNFTQVPNIILDYWIKELAPAEFKLLMVIARQTYGWHKDETYISLNQLVSLSGLSRRGILKLIKTLESKELVIIKRFESVEKGWGTSLYSLNLGSDAHGSAQNAQGGEELNALPLGNSVPPLNKESISNDIDIKKDNSSVTHKACFTEEISFSFDKKEFENISSQDRSNWRTLYPFTDIDQEILKIKEWLMSNPSKSKKKLWRKFITGWLSRANDKQENVNAYKNIGVKPRDTIQETPQRTLDIIAKHRGNK